MAKLKRKNKQKPKEEIAEDYCFICKDGGKLLICDYKQCLKSYHLGCVKKDESFSSSKETWVCGWHTCMVCHKASQIQCYCCPNATCWDCTHIAELVNIKGKYGFCSFCLKLALLVEDHRDADSDGEKVDFRDRDTYEGLFMEYYMIIKASEGFSSDNLRAARNRLDTGKNILSGSEADDSEDEEEEEMSFDEDEDNVRGYKRQQKSKRFKKGLHVMRCVKSKRMQFCGWASIPLREFLKSIGKDTSEKLSQHDVYFIICKYITANNLHDPKKKKMIVFDEKLQSIFQKKTVNKNKIFGLLEDHFLENLEESEKEEPEDEDETPPGTFKSRKVSKTERASPKKDPIHTVPHSCYALLTAENIKHVYLRRSLVYELSKQRESFERKVIGSFVRVKSDPYDYHQRNSHQLVKVTGIVKFVTGENNTEITLCVSRVPKEISISLLSDGDFSEEECEDLQQNVKDGLVQKPTVVVLQEKANSLHVDITKHWIDRELKSLPSRIDRANEKGWRRELYEYLERKKLLETPSEQARLLEEYPVVIPDVADIVDEQQLVEPSPPSNLGEEKEEYRADLFAQEGNQNVDRMADPVSPHYATSLDEMYESEMSIGEEHTQIHLASNDQHDVTSQIHADKFSHSASLRQNHSPGDQHNVTSQIDADSSTSVNHQNDDAKQVTFKNQKPLVDEVIELDSNDDDDDNQPNDEKQQNAPPANEVIDLGSDDDNDSQTNAAVDLTTLEDTENKLWLISGPDGVPREDKYELSLLKRWSEITNYALRFKVWKEDQSQEQAIPLGDAVKLAF